MNLPLFDQPPPARTDREVVPVELLPAPERTRVLAAGVDPISHLDDCEGCAECEILERFFSRCPACGRWSATDSWPEPLRCLSCCVLRGNPEPSAEERRKAEERGSAALHRAFLALARAIPSAPLC